jgi:HEAT repeat protein
MGLLELCLLPLLLPQQPASQAPTASPAPVAAATAPQGDGRPATAPAATADPVEVTELKAAEQGLATIDIEQLVALTASANPAVATRATWLLGQRKEPKAFEHLHELARSAPHTDMRLQAMSALLRHGNPTSAATAIAGLDDEDARVRSVAAQLLGRLRNPAGAAPLLALLDRSKKAKSQGPNQTTIDLQAAILALNDMEATEHLLTAATAIDASKAPGTGQALTFYFQNLSPRLAPRDEALLLVGVLGHRESMLRRYAIERLADLADPTASAALEGRLAQEGPELRPLLEVALARVRKQEHGQAQDAPKAPTDDVVQQLRERWSAMSQQQQYVTAGFAGLFVISSIFVFSMWRRRSRELLADDVPAVADLVAPSEEYLEELENEAAMAAEEAEAMAQTELTGGEEEQSAEDADDDSFVRAMTSGAEDEPDANDAWAPVLGDDSDTDPQRD